jgi:hypothetical protein
MIIYTVKVESYKANCETRYSSEFNGKVGQKVLDMNSYFWKNDGIESYIHPYTMNTNRNPNLMQR